MARIRSLKPEFWDDRKLARSTSRDARMLYMGLWNQADEHSRLNGDEVWIKGRVFPYDDDLDVGRIKALLGELADAGRIVLYDVDGDPFIFLRKLSKHQRLEPAKVDSRLPEPPADLFAHENTPRANSSEPRADSPALLYGSGVMDQGSGSMGQGSARETAPRATRIPPEWAPSPDLVDAMRAEGIPDTIARRELPRFRDYWAGIGGQRGRKTDWDATWRNWLRKADDEQRPPRASPSGSTTDQRVDEGIALAATLRANQPKDLPA